jgi:hypothetical protein
LAREKIEDYHGVSTLTHGRNVSYDIPDPNLPEASQWLISNPNRINLGRVGLEYKGSLLSASQVTEPHQELDLWNGVITSTFKVDGQAVKVVTQGDFDSDSVIFHIDSELVSSGDLTVGLDFPYPPIHSTKYKYEVFVGSYEFPMNHTTSLERSSGANTAHIFHEMQETSYYLNLRWPSGSPLRISRKENKTHRHTLIPSTSTIIFTANFSPEKHTADLPSTIQHRSSAAWNQYWARGGFIDLTSSPNPSADELQRRIILSQYHVRVNSAANGQSPQESGLMNNGWYGTFIPVLHIDDRLSITSLGKFHLEMVVWHNAHWATWGRQKLFDKIFPELYETLLPSSIARAKSMGWDGARSAFSALCREHV